MSSGEILSGQTGEIKVSLNTRGRIGKFAKSIGVYSNDPGRPKIFLTLTVRVRR
ncbi:MAG: DUF1573 domain-containing protein [Calditrichaceae bacterium]|nr:DUF1573 domain-containing protein [Calditrichaceae bacterium]MBN2710781.1 DUF1573 domain-containing protein [Calditrichaceae bacterium]RQV94723.1 MAG: DUF1573 domain-containing protein [Calditrichota bacterium]